MHIILGATGHVGSAVAKQLLADDERVMVVTHNAAKVQQWEDRGAEVAVVDVHDVRALQRVLSLGERVFLLNPPAPVTSDTIAEERRSLNSIFAAMEGLTFERVVAESTYGAQPGDGIGDLGVLYEMEAGLKRRGLPTSIIRAAYYMSNWDAALNQARETGKLMSMFPLDLKIPMVAPEDLGRAAARLLTEPTLSRGIHPVEGPERYSAREVAAAFSDVLGRNVEAVQTPDAKLEETYQSLGFSEPAARSYAAMTRVTAKTQFPDPGDVQRGEISLEQYLESLVQREAASSTAQSVSP